MTQQPALIYFRSIAAVLGDDEPGRPFQRYTLHDMVQAYNRGSAIVYAFRPDLFTVIKKMKLEPGNRQNGGGCCDNILAVLEQVDENGNVISEITNARRNSSKTTLKSWGAKPSCLIHTDVTGATIDYVIDYVTVDPNLNSYFSVYPPVPCDTDVYVNVKCVTPPCELHEENINGAMPGMPLHNTALWHYVLSAMLNGDRHAAGASAESVNNFNIFLKLLDIEQKQEYITELEGTQNVLRQNAG